MPARFPADYPILVDFYLDRFGSKYQRLSGRPRIQGRPLNGFQIAFPIKAPTRQMLYPLSYEGINVNGLRMLARQLRIL